MKVIRLRYLIEEELKLILNFSVAVFVLDSLTHTHARTKREKSIFLQNFFCVLVFHGTVDRFVELIEVIELITHAMP